MKASCELFFSQTDVGGHCRAEVFDLILDKLRFKVCVKQGQQSLPTLDIMESQSVNWRNNRSWKSFDGNKKVKGIKRHIVVD